MHDAMPTSADVSAFLSGLTIAGTTAIGITVPSGFDMDSEVNAAIDSWNRRTGYRPFLQTSEATVAVTFDPPGPDQFGNIVGGSNKLALGNGLLSLTSVVVSVDPTETGSGDTLTQGIDFWTGPSIAPTQVPPEPYTEIVFGFVQRGLRQSIVVTGIWGYCQGFVPDDVWRTVRNWAAGNVLQELMQGMLIGVTSWKDLDQGESFSPELIGKLGQSLLKSGANVLSRYRLLDF